MVANVAVVEDGRAPVETLVCVMQAVFGVGVERWSPVETEATPPSIIVEDPATILLIDGDGSAGGVRERNGVALVRQLRATWHLRNPVILTSFDAPERLIQHPENSFLKHQPGHYIMRKPWRMDDIAALLTTASPVGIEKIQGVSESANLNRLVIEQICSVIDRLSAVRQDIDLLNLARARSEYGALRIVLWRNYPGLFRETLSAADRSLERLAQLADPMRREIADGGSSSFSVPHISELKRQVEIAISQLDNVVRELCALYGSRVRHSLASCRAAARVVEGAFEMGVLDRRTAEQTLRALADRVRQHEAGSARVGELLYKEIQHYAEAVGLSARIRSSPRLLNEWGLGGKALLVDDEHETTGWGLVLATVLRPLGVALTACSDWREAVRKIENEDDINLVLLDVRLEGQDMHGLDVLTEVKRRRPQLRVVMLSGIDEAYVATRALSLGAASYIVKEPRAEGFLSKAGEAPRESRTYFLRMMEEVRRAFPGREERAIGEKLREWRARIDGVKPGLTSEMTGALDNAFKNVEGGPGRYEVCVKDCGVFVERVVRSLQSQPTSDHFSPSLELDDLKSKGWVSEKFARIGRDIYRYRSKRVHSIGKVTAGKVLEILDKTLEMAELYPKERSRVEERKKQVDERKRTSQGRGLTTLRAEDVRKLKGLKDIGPKPKPGNEEGSVKGGGGSSASDTQGKSSTPAAVRKGETPTTKLKKRIFVGGLGPAVTEADLRGEFGRYGTVIEVVFGGSPKTGPRYVLVEMSSSAEAEGAIQGLNEKQLAGRTLTVRIAE